MSRSKLMSRKLTHLALFSVFPIGLIVVPTAILLNLWAFSDMAARYTNTVYVCICLAMFGLSLVALILPEIRRVTHKNFRSLVLLIGLLITFASLVLAIFILLAQKLTLQGVLTLLVVLGGIALFYLGKNWTIWAAK